MDVSSQRGFGWPESYNPFNSSTTITFELAAAGSVHLELYDLLGRRVRRLVDGSLAAGTYRVGWNGTDESGRQVTSSVYLCRLHGGGGATTRSLLLLR